ncbi:glycosyltransferase family 2 protein [Olleya namhaensis]|uniref:Glycosyltransferase involved in cell wall bisynthesis n=1 Tax=Olleya namhaensis TaxID=1144750 RepID=A0A1I3NIX2_9FLAO|nr:glycosyltransferase family 2 protein [Olleya namhaensis]SFJ09263.1 Glycosyltransferase involved in cell wall bisynthesis [Olleya namhaensis]
MSTPLVSIIMPVYNGEKFLEEAIDSCLNQTHTNIELIIVNDCSTDRSLEIATKLQKKDNRIVIINNNKNLKLPASLNVGHKAGKGEYVTWTSDDNIYNLNAIERLLTTLKINKVDLVYSDISKIDANGKELKEVSFLSFENILFGNFIGSCFLYKMEVFNKNDGYNESLFLVEDYDFWLRASLHSKFFQLKENLYNYRLHRDSLTHSISSNNNKNKLFIKNVELMYSSFAKSIMLNNHEVIARFQTNILIHKEIQFDWIKRNKNMFFEFLTTLSKLKNYSNKSALKKLLMNKITYVFVLNYKEKQNISRAAFIILNFYSVLDTKTIKTLIKYSFFKK